MLEINKKPAASEKDMIKNKTVIRRTKKASTCFIFDSLCVTCDENDEDKRLATS